MGTGTAAFPLPKPPWATLEGAARLLQPLCNTMNPLLKPEFTVLIVTGLRRVFQDGERKHQARKREGKKSGTQENFLEEMHHQDSH